MSSPVQLQGNVADKHCLFVEFDRFDSHYIDNVTTLSRITSQLKLACIYYPHVNICSDVFSSDPRLLDALYSLAPLVKAGLIWPSGRLEETPQAFIERKLQHYAQRSYCTGTQLSEMRDKWLHITPSCFTPISRQLSSQLHAMLDALYLDSEALAHPSAKPILQQYLLNCRHLATFDRAEYIALLHWMGRSLGQSMRHLALLSATHYAYYATQYQSVAYQVFNGDVAKQFGAVNPHFSHLIADTQHTLKLRDALARQQLPIEVLLTWDNHSLASLLGDDSFKKLRHNYRQPLHVISHQKVTKTAIGFSSYPVAATLNYTRACAVDIAAPSSPGSFIMLDNQRPLLFFNAREHSHKISMAQQLILKMLVNNPQGVPVTEVLVMLEVSRQLDERQRISIDLLAPALNLQPFSKQQLAQRDDRLQQRLKELRNSLDAKIIRDFNHQLSPEKLQLKVRNKTLLLLRDDQICSIILVEGPSERTLKFDEENYCSKASSRACAILNNLHLLLTPIHSTLLTSFLNFIGANTLSRAVSEANSVLRHFKLNVYSPSRRYYLLQSPLQENK